MFFSMRDFFRFVFIITNYDSRTPVIKVYWIGGFFLFNNWRGIVLEELV